MMLIELGGKKGKGVYTIVDKEDFEEMSKYTLRFVGGYAYIYTYQPDTKTAKNILLHRFIMGNPEGLMVDHINGNKLDNRRSNLRICTNKENSRNSSKQVRNKNKYKGIQFIKSSKNYVARIIVDGKHKHLGTFKTEEDAATAYNEAAYIYFGEFAKLNKVIL